MSDDKKKLTGAEEEAYKQGRQGRDPLFKSDSESEAGSRLRGKQDRENAKQTQKEEEEKKKEEE